MQLENGKTLFYNGKRNIIRKIIKTNESFALVEDEDETRQWCDLDFLYDDCFEQIPRDLHDKNGTPLKLGDLIETNDATKVIVTGAYFENNTIWVTSDDNCAWHEYSVEKIGARELLDVMATLACVYLNTPNKCYKDYEALNEMLLILNNMEQEKDKPNQ